MIRILYNFMANLNDFKIKLTILIAIKKDAGLKTKNQVKKYILNLRSQNENQYDKNNNNNNKKKS